MKRLDQGNLLGVLGCFAVAAALLELVPTAAGATASRPAAASAGALRDARGAWVPLRDYRRIVSASVVSDFVLHALVEPERLVAYTSRSVNHPLFSDRFRGKPGVDGVGELEPLLQLRPDLVVMSHFADPRHAARLRDRGIELYDLGEMRGLASLLDDIEQLGALVGKPAQAERMAAELSGRMKALAAHVPRGRRPRGLYLAVYTHKLFGGTRNTSYHDVLTAAGVIDVAAERYEGWPPFDGEQVLVMDPELIVTKQGMGASLCRLPGLEHLRPCRGRGRIIELEPSLIDEPGPPMLQAAEALYEAVWGEAPPPSSR
jgi:iron complex transport system substrate-binding protein